MFLSATPKSFMKGMKKRKRVKMKIKPTLVMFIKRIKKMVKMNKYIRKIMSKRSA